MLLFADSASNIRRPPRGASRPEQGNPVIRRVGREGGLKDLSPKVRDAKGTDQDPTPHLITKAGGKPDDIILVGVSQSLKAHLQQREGTSSQ